MENVKGIDHWRLLGTTASQEVLSPEHYDANVQPIDLIESVGALEGFCIGSIIKYASRYPDTNNTKDLLKVIDYARILIGYKLDMEEF